MRFTSSLPSGWFIRRVIPVLALGAVITADAKVTFPNLQGLLTLKADFHQHTVFSDGKVWPNVRVEEGVRDGLDVMAITDHIEWQPHGRDIPHENRNRSYELAQLAASLPAGMSEGDYWLVEQRRAGREDLISGQSTLRAKPAGAEGVPTPQEILVLNGAEITQPLPLGHINAIFLEDASRLVGLDGIGSVREAARQGAYLFWNHPWSPQTPPIDGIARLTDIQRQLMSEGIIQGIEVVNTLTYSPEAFQIALDQNLAIFANSDIHSLIEWVYPAARRRRPFTLIFATERTPAAIREALEQRRTVAWFNHTLIGRAEWVEQLVRASIKVRAVGYSPDRSRFSIQDRPDTSLLEMELRNISGSRFIFRPSGDVLPANEPTVVTIEPESTVRLTLPTGERKARLAVTFDVLNALVAPGQNLTATWEIEIPR